MIFWVTFLIMFLCCVFTAMIDHICSSEVSDGKQIVCENVVKVKIKKHCDYIFLVHFETIASVCGKNCSYFLPSCQSHSETSHQSQLSSDVPHRYDSSEEDARQPGPDVEEVWRRVPRENKTHQPLLCNITGERPEVYRYIHLDVNKLEQCNCFTGFTEELVQRSLTFSSSYDVIFVNMKG